ncbi:hypothetical protein ABT404_21425 [Streptomyces hyaluromycini]|uniref:Uncharacterized protein n=1 Tax=Streptomyces hyaluromycini TaxID=1377993 RepID=A0ABV1WZ11_9ACTN
MTARPFLPSNVVVVAPETRTLWPPTTASSLLPPTKDAASS